jgi:TPR repeat protein
MDASDALSTVDMFRLAEKAGHLGAQCTLAYAYQQGIGMDRDPDRALDLWRKAAEQGFASAMYELGLSNLESESPDAKVAASWFRKAAAGGFAPAQYRLAKLYEAGEGVAADELCAREWLRAAARAGHPQAQAEITRRSENLY